MPKEIPKNQQGVQACAPFGQGQICVTGRRYGYEAWIVGRDGKNKAPISIGKPHTVRQALRIAVAKAERIRDNPERERRQRRGPRFRGED